MVLGIAVRCSREGSGQLGMLCCTPVGSKERESRCSHASFSGGVEDTQQDDDASLPASVFLSLCACVRVRERVRVCVHREDEAASSADDGHF